MKKAFDDYQNLAGRTLWQGPDHLLYIERVGWPLTFRESYKRIDYAKIQAISYGRTRTFGWIIGWLALLLALLLWALLANLSSGVVPTTIFGTLSGLVLLLLLVHIARGPTCVCRLQTAVQVLKLGSLRRVRPTMQCVARLTELCLQHQGGQALSPELLAAAQAAVATGPDAGLPELVRGPKPPYPGSRLVLAALPLMIVGGGMMLAEPFIQNLGFFFTSAVVGGTADIMVLLALAWCTRYALPVTLKLSLWGGLGAVLLSFVAGYALLMKGTLLNVQNAARGAPRSVMMDSQFGFWKWMSDASLADMGWIGWLWMACGVLSIFFGILGLPAGMRRGPTAPVRPMPPSLVPNPPDAP